MLVECPECKKMISDQAVSCPNCGYVLHEIEPPYYDPAPANEGCFMQTMNVGCLAVAAILALCVLCVAFDELSSEDGWTYLLIFGGVVALSALVRSRNNRRI